MAVKLLFFAQCADWMKCREMEITLSQPVQLQEIINRSPELAPVATHRKNLIVSINCTLKDFFAEVNDGDEVAFLPPFSGG